MDRDDIFEIRHLKYEDFALLKSLVTLLREVFEREDDSTPPDPYFEELLLKPGFIAYVTISNSQVVAGLTAYELPVYYTGDLEIFLYDIGVKAEFQRKGLGTNLLSALRQYAKQRGIQEIFVAAEEVDEHALEFYRATGGVEQKVSHFSYLA